MKLGLPVTLVSGLTLLIWMLFGSSSHMPALPFGAEASAGLVTSRYCLPEVSM